MIGLLSEWIQQIILIILLATFIDFLLPNSTFHKYSKLVISLFILLTILSPILKIISSDFNYDSFISSLTIEKGEQKINDRINSLTGELSTLNKEIIEKKIADELQVELNQYIEKEFGNYGVSNLKIDLLENKEATTITNLQVVINKNNVKVSKETSKKTNEVKKVEIPIVKIKPVILSEEKNINSENFQNDDKYLDMIQKISAYIQSKWGLSDKEIEIMVEK